MAKNTNTNTNTVNNIPAPAVYQGFRMGFGLFEEAYFKYPQVNYETGEEFTAPAIVIQRIGKDAGKIEPLRCNWNAANRIAGLKEAGVIKPGDYIEVFRKSLGKFMHKELKKECDIWGYRVVNRTTGEVLMDYPQNNEDMH